MRGWILTTIAVTFLSGASTGFLLGRSDPEPKAQNGPGRVQWKEKYIEALRERSGVTREDDLDRARAILDDYDSRVQALKSRLPEEIREEIRKLGEEATEQIRRIIDSYRSEPLEEKDRDG